MPDEPKKPELTLLGESSEMSEEEIVESLMKFIESKVDSKADN